MRRVLGFAFGLAVLGLVACGGDEVGGRTAISMHLPERVQCAAPPAAIKAQLWISGMSQPCDLKVGSDRSVTGECPDITARIDRRATLDYFILDDLTTAPPGVTSPYRLLLAQATRTLALERPESDRVELSFADSDFVASAACRDMLHIDEETGEGASLVEDFVATGKPCDLDDDGAGNLEELCVSPATDPYMP